MPSFSGFLSRMLDLVLPRRDRTVRIESYQPEDVPLSPTEHEALGLHITTLMSYREKAAEDLIRAVKYDHSEYAARLLADALAEYLREEIAQIKAFSIFPVILVPIPLHANRERERGHNQIESILNELPSEFLNGELSHVAHILARTRETQSQTKLARMERLSNVEGAFTLTVPNLVSKAHVFLIDDVTTTGATLSEAARPLTPVAESVRLLALARAGQ